MGEKAIYWVNTGELDWIGVLQALSLSSSSSGQYVPLMILSFSGFCTLYQFFTAVINFGVQPTNLTLISKYKQPRKFVVISPPLPLPSWQRNSAAGTYTRRPFHWLQCCESVHVFHKSTTEKEITALCSFAIDHIDYVNIYVVYMIYGFVKFIYLVAMHW